jgi:hypothetical protein
MQGQRMSIQVPTYMATEENELCFDGGKISPVSSAFSRIERNRRSSEHHEHQRAVNNHMYTDWWQHSFSCKLPSMARFRET